MAAHPRALRLVVLVALAAAAHAPAAHAQTSTADSAPRRPSLTLPREVAGFTLRGRRDYEDKRLGISLRYQAADSTTADVYLYPGPGFDAACDARCSAGVLAREVAEFRSGFGEMIKRGYFRTIDVASDSILQPSAGSAWRLAHRLQLRVTDSASTRDRSDFALFYLPHYRVKVRTTYVATPEREAALRAFLDALVPAITSAPAASPPAASSPPGMP